MWGPWFLTRISKLKQNKTEIGKLDLRYLRNKFLDYVCPKDIQVHLNFHEKKIVECDEHIPKCCMYIIKINWKEILIVNYLSQAVLLVDYGKDWIQTRLWPSEQILSMNRCLAELLL